jgi:hypothetical protein
MAFLGMTALAWPGTAASQIVFDWPVRVSPQPEPVLTGAGAVFWNPGSLVAGVGTSEEVWLAHVDGPDVTGVRGVATAGIVDLPFGFRLGLGYWHLGIQDIPRTTTSPHEEAGEINVSEDMALATMAWSLGPRTGIGGGLRFQRGAAGRDAKSRTEGELGIHHQANVPLLPRFGLTIQGLGGEVRFAGGAEVSLPSLASSRIPLRLGYGIRTDRDAAALDHRLSFRGSWMDQIHVGTGLSYLGEGNGWVSMWMLGADLGRYSVSILRESLANGFGAVHFFQASIRFP